MAYIRDHVIVLKKEPFREQDRRYVMYGREHGLLVAVARGSAVRTSKQAGHLEPFSESDVMIAKGAAFDKLAVARMRIAPKSPRLAALVVCGGVTNLVVNLMRPGIADERVFFLVQELIHTCNALPADPSPERARLLLAAAALRLMDILGFAPPIARPSEGTTPVSSLALVAFMRRSSFTDVLRVTGSTDVLASASAFVEEALRETHLDVEPHGARTVQWLVS